jgi:hypothetical protein
MNISTKIGSKWPNGFRGDHKKNPELFPRWGQQPKLMSGILQQNCSFYHFQDLKGPKATNIHNFEILFQ